MFGSEIGASARGNILIKGLIKTEEINIKEMLKLNHILSLKHFSVKFELEGLYDVYIVPMNKEYSPDKNPKMFEMISDYYKKLGYDAIIDETLMCFHLCRS